MKSQFKEMATDKQGELMVALIAGSPLLVGMAGCLIGGMLTDRYVRRTGDRNLGRRIFAMFGYGMAGVSYLLATVFIGDFWAFAVYIMMMGFFNDLMMSAAWATCQDVGRRYSAIVSGCMNMVGNLAGALTSFITGAVLKHYQHDQPSGIKIMFTVYAIVYFVGVLLWLGIDASKPIVPETMEGPAKPKEVDFAVE
jgi:MFS transporter, ACS family, glucarate transporter